MFDWPTKPVRIPGHIVHSYIAILLKIAMNLENVGFRCNYVPVSCQIIAG